MSPVNPDPQAVEGQDNRQIARWVCEQIALQPFPRDGPPRRNGSLLGEPNLPQTRSEIGFRLLAWRRAARPGIIGTGARAGRSRRPEVPPRLRRETQSLCLGHSPILRRWPEMPRPFRWLRGRSGTTEALLQSLWARDAGSFESRLEHVRVQAGRTNVQEGKIMAWA